MAEVLGNQNDHDRSNQKHGVHREDRSVKLRQTDPGSVGNDAEINGFAKAQAVGKDHVDEVGEHKAGQNEELLQQAPRIDGNAAHAEHREKRHPVVKVRASHAAHGCGSQVQTDDRHNGTRHNRRHELFNPGDARPHDDQAHNGIDDAAGNDAAQSQRNIGVGAASGNVTRCGDHDADKGKGGTEVTRDVAAYDQKEENRTDTAHEDGHVRVKPHQQRSQDGGTEHCHDVLNTQSDHLAGGKSFIGSDDAVCF